MKSLAIVTLGLFAALGAAQTYANELFPLLVPADIPKGNQPSLRTCIANTFNADDSSNGMCTSVTALPSSGRVAPPPYNWLIYATIFDTTGNPVSDVFCGTARTHAGQQPTFTYQPGFDVATCFIPVSGYPDILVYDPRYGYEHWFGYVTTSPDGAYELLTYGRSGYINQF